MKHETNPEALKGRHMIARGEAPGTVTPPPHPYPAKPGEGTEHIGDPRALDAWIAEHLFGQVIKCQHKNITNLRGSLKQCDDCGEQFGDTTLCIALSAWPFYSTDPAAAMQVLEKCLNKGGGIQIFDVTVSQVKRFKVSRVDYESIAETLPLAICLFAKHLTSGQPWPVLSIHG